MKLYLKIVLSMVVLLWGATAMAQNIVTGIVEDADGPLIGATGFVVAQVLS